MIVIVDLDGTLADCTHRLHHIKKPHVTEDDWTKFFMDVYNDLPIPAMAELLNKFVNSGDTVLICTGRNERFGGPLTIEWLEKHKFHPAEVYFRKDGDHRPDYVIKKEMLDIITEKYGKPDIAFEDRKSVVEMWRSNGIFCCQVAEGDF
jgi:hypothetical protein